ncbi:MAG: hypothetical protein ACYTXY_30735, partial [Nostoc sp.]
SDSLTLRYSLVQPAAELRIFSELKRVAFISQLFRQGKVINFVGYVSRLMIKINTAHLIETGGFFNVDFSTNARKF